MTDTIGYHVFSERCRSSNMDDHGFCDGIADDGEPCLCDSCHHPSALADRKPHGSGS